MKWLIKFFVSLYFCVSLYYIVKIDVYPQVHEDILLCFVLESLLKVYFIFSGGGQGM